MSALRAYQAADVCKEDGAGYQPEATLWQTYPEQEIMASDNKKMNVNVVAVFGDCGDISSSMLIAGAYPADRMCLDVQSVPAGILLVGKYQRDWDAGKGGRKAVLCPRHI